MTQKHKIWPKKEGMAEHTNLYNFQRRKKSIQNILLKDTQIV